MNILTPSFPFFLLEERLEVISFFTRLLGESLEGKSKGFEAFSLSFDTSGPDGSFRRLRFKTQFLLSILLDGEPFSFTIAYGIVHLKPENQDLQASN